MAKQLGYRPNAIVSGLHGGRTRSVAAMWDFYGGNRVTALDILRECQTAQRAGTYTHRYNNIACWSSLASSPS